MRIEVIAQPGRVPDAVLLPADVRYHGRRATAAAAIALQLPPAAVFDAKLSLKWGCLVACTREFSAWWRGRNGRPNGFFLTQLS